MDCDFSGAGQVDKTEGTDISSLEEYPHLSRTAIEAQMEKAFDNVHGNTAHIEADPNEQISNEDVFWVGKAYAAPKAINCATITLPNCNVYSTSGQAW